MFVTEDDYKVVVGDTALKVISQVSEKNRANAEAEAREEISGYLRPKYDCGAIFSAEGDNRNRLIVMYTCDIALYHMSASLPQKNGQRDTGGALQTGHQVAGRGTGRDNHSRPAADRG